jgi:mono/diheme cytochrome c family protein
MATQRTKNRNSGRGGRSLSFVFGVLFTLVVLFAGGWIYLRYGNPPVAASDPSFPFEAQIVHVPLNARIARQMQQPPFGASEDAFEDGARVYMQHCAMCHGAPGHDVEFAQTMFPHAPQLWKAHWNQRLQQKITGVSRDQPGETYWKVKNGIRLTGMPSYQKILSDSQMWDVSLLLKNSSQPLPDPVSAILAAK